jgi:hypothetical protein
MSKTPVEKYTLQTCNDAYEDMIGSFKVGVHNNEYYEWYMDFPIIDEYTFVVNDVITNRGVVKAPNIYECIITDTTKYAIGYVRCRVIPIGITLTVPSVIVQKGTQWRRV